MICGSSGGTVRHQLPSKTSPVSPRVYGNKTIWFTVIAAPPYPKVHEKPRELLFFFFVHVTDVAVPIRRVSPLSGVSSSDRQYVMERKCTIVQCSIETCVLFLLKQFNKWEGAVLDWNPLQSVCYATALVSESLKHLSLSKPYQTYKKPKPPNLVT